VDSDLCTCFDVESAPFVLGDVTAETRAELVAHLDSCGRCRREVSTLVAALDSISAAVVPVEPSAGFVDRVLAAAAVPRTSQDTAWAPGLATSEAGGPALSGRPTSSESSNRRGPKLVWPERDDPMTLTMASERREDGLEPAPVGQQPVAVVLRRRRTVLGLTGITAGLLVTAMAFDAPTLWAMATVSAVLTVAYLALVIGVTHTRARHDMAQAFDRESQADDAFWRELQPAPTPRHAPDEPLSPPVVAVHNADLARFVVAYFVGWALTPVVATIQLVRGDLTGIEQSPLLAHLVVLQQRGRSQSLKLLVAGATTVAVAGGTGAIFISPSLASASTSAQTYTVHDGDTLWGIAARYGLSASYLAQVNGISDPNLIFTGDVLRLGQPGQSSGSGTGTGTGTETRGGSSAYTVRDGDTLYAIAIRFGTTVSELESLNHFTDPNLIFTGQRVVLPGSAQTPPAAQAPPAAQTTPAPASGPSRGSVRTYRVQIGDTLDAIAARFGTTLGALIAANHISNPNLIYEGQVLVIEGPGATPAATPVSPAPSAPSRPPAAPAPAPSRAPSTSGYVNPFAVGSWSPSRIDEGVDWIPNVVSPVVAIGNGIVTYSSMDSGWPAGGFITYRLTSGSHAGLYIYVAEHITDLLPVGTAVSAGERIATALPGYPWTEWGWASASGPEPAPGSQYGGAPDGTSTPGGKAFARFLMSLGVTGIEDPGPGPTTP
jgi:LysM repeat protein